MGRKNPGGGGGIMLYVKKKQNKMYFTINHLFDIKICVKKFYTGNIWKCDVYNFVRPVYLRSL